MKDLIEELKKAKYDGLSDIDAHALLPLGAMELGKIINENKLDLFTLIVTRDIEDRLDENANREDTDTLFDEFSPAEKAQYKYLAKLCQRAFSESLLMSDNYWINLSIPDIKYMLDGALAFGHFTAQEYARIIELATYKTEGFDNYTVDDVSHARSKSEPTVSIETTYVSQDYLVKGRKDTLHQIDITVEAIAWPDTITVYAQSQNNGDASFVEFNQPVGVLQVPANYVGTLQLTVNKSALKNKCKYFLSSKYNRTLSGYAYNNG